MAAQRATRPPIANVFSAGAVAFRDVRLWHAGVPNHSDEVRHMLALVYNSSRLRSALVSCATQPCTHHGARRMPGPRVSCDLHLAAPKLSTTARESTSVDHNIILVDEEIIDHVGGSVASGTDALADEPPVRGLADAPAWALRIFGAQTKEGGAPLVAKI